MPYRYDKRRQHVPLDVAREVAAQRDEALRELHQLRREKDRLSARLNAVKIESDELEARARAAEADVERLQEELAEARQAADADVERGSDERDSEFEELVEHLRERVAGLTNDLERVRSRTNEAVQQARSEERNRLLSGLGEVLDSVERGLDATAENSPWRAGLLGIQSQLYSFMNAQGAELTGAVGDVLDPRVHEAVGVVEADDTAPGEIVRVLRHGIELEDGTIARAAQVVVAT